jgi:hypothetical protein
MTDRTLAWLVVGLILVLDALSVVVGILPTGAPLAFDPSEIVLAEPVCPGDVLPLGTVLDIERPSIITTVTSVIDEGSGITVWLEPPVVRSRDRAERVRFHIDWPVPHLPAGAYRRVTGAFGASLGASTTFFVARFRIGEVCES